MPPNNHPHQVYRYVSKGIWHHIWIEFDENNPRNHIVKIYKDKRESEPDFSIWLGIAIYRWTGKNFCLMRLEIQSFGNELRYFLRATRSSLACLEFDSQYSRIPNPAAPKRSPTAASRKKKFVSGDSYSRAKARMGFVRKAKIPKTSSNLPVEFKPIEFIKTEAFEGNSNSISLNLHVYSSVDELSKIAETAEITARNSILKNSPHRSAWRDQNKNMSPRRSVQFAALPTIHEPSIEHDSSPEHSSLQRRFHDVREPLWLLWFRACKTPLGKWGCVFLLFGLVGVVAATQGTALFYGATTTSIIGSTLLGINLFRAYPRRSDQDKMPISFVPRII